MAKGAVCKTAITGSIPVGSSKPYSSVRTIVRSTFLNPGLHSDFHECAIRDSSVLFSECGLCGIFLVGNTFVES